MTTKDRSLAAVRWFALDLATDNVADAICIAEYAKVHLKIGGIEIPFSIDPQLARAA